MKADINLFLLTDNNEKSEINMLLLFIPYYIVCDQVQWMRPSFCPIK